MRINIENKWFSDPRRNLLIQRLGSSFLADGIWLQAILLAQEYWGQDYALIPEKIFSLFEHNDALVDCCLVEKRDGGFYLCGSKEHLSWVAERRAAGRNGGSSKRKQNEANASKTKQTLPSSSSSSSKDKYNYINTNTSPRMEEHNAEPNYDTMAQTCLQAIQRYGPDDSVALKKFVGEELFSQIAKSIGWASVREIKRDHWAAPNLAKKLSGVLT